MMASPVSSALAASADTDAQAQFTAFYRQGCPDVFRQLYALTRDRAEAQDCLHEAYVRAWQHWASVSQHPDPQAWVRRVAYRQAISRWRKARSRLVAHRRHGPPEPSPALTPDAIAVEQALATLPPHHREVAVLHYLADLSIAEVATTVGIPEGTVKTRLMRARQLLRHALDEGADEAGEAPASR